MQWINVQVDYWVMMMQDCLHWCAMLLKSDLKRALLKVYWTLLRASVAALAQGPSRHQGPYADPYP